jgi:hypothetical protein
LAAFLASAGGPGRVILEIPAGIGAATAAALIAVIFGIRCCIAHHLSPLAMVHTANEVAPLRVPLFLIFF